MRAAASVLGSFAILVALAMLGVDAGSAVAARDSCDVVVRIDVGRGEERARLLVGTARAEQPRAYAPVPPGPDLAAPRRVDPDAFVETSPTDGTRACLTLAPGPHLVSIPAMVGSETFVVEEWIEIPDAPKFEAVLRVELPEERRGVRFEVASAAPERGGDHLVRGERGRAALARRAR